MLHSLIRPSSTKTACRILLVTRKLLNTAAAIEDTNPKLSKDIVRYRVKKPFKKNFIENLFLGKFEPEVLEYPEIRTQEEVDYLVKHREKIEGLLLHGCNDKENKLHGKITKEVMDVLNENELIGMKLKHGEEGLGYFESESTYLQESLLNSSLGRTIAEYENCGYQIINLFGNETQKNHYIPKLLNNSCIACLAHLENGAWVPSDSSLTTSAVKLPDETYSISGQKSLVYNPSNADIIIVSARTSMKTDEGIPSPYTLFIVDKNSKGLSINEPLNKIGLECVEICDVVFDNVIVPKECVIGVVNEGNKIINELLARGKLCNGAQCISLMRKMLNDTIKYCLHKEHFNKPLYRYKYIQGKIGELTSVLYEAESMTYLMLGRVDLDENLNGMFESLIVKIFCSEALNFTLHNYMQLTGWMKNYHDEFIDRLLSDCHFFTAFDDSNGYLKMLLGTAGVKYTMEQMEHQTVKKYKPKSSAALKWYRLSGDIPIPDILKGYLHLAFEEQSRGLERCVETLNLLTETLIFRHSDDALNRSHEIRQLAEVVIIIYGLASILGRASRSYCIGLRHSEEEVTLARTIVNKNISKCESIRTDLLNILYGKRKFNFVGRYALDNCSYEPVHPVYVTRSREV